MSLIEQYEQQYATLIAEITINISKLRDLTGSEHRNLSSIIDGSLAEAHELLEQINLEIRDLNVAQRPSFTNKLNCAQVELQRLQNDYRTVKEIKERKHNTVINLDAGDYDYDDLAIDNDQRQRLLQNSERIERTGRGLTEGYRVALETETIGAQVLSDLQQQRETLQSAQSRLRETNADLGRASRTLNNMMYRAMREKMLLYVVGGCFLLAVGFSLYLTFSAPTPSTN